MTRMLIDERISARFIFVVELDADMDVQTILRVTSIRLVFYQWNIQLLSQKHPKTWRIQVLQSLPVAV